MTLQNIILISVFFRIHILFSRGLEGISVEFLTIKCVDNTILSPRSHY